MAGEDDQVSVVKSPTRRGTKQTHFNENMLQVPKAEVFSERSQSFDKQSIRTVKKQVAIVPLDLKEVEKLNQQDQVTPPVNDQPGNILLKRSPTFSGSNQEENVG